MSEPSPEQSFTIHLKSLTDFADEFKTQIESLQAPMDHLATMSGTPPQYGAFHEAWSLGAGEQAAIEEMYSLLGQVKTAIAFAGDVTGTVAQGYRNADESIAFALGGPPPGQSGKNQQYGPWQNGQQPDPNQIQYTDPSQVTATPVNSANDQGPWVPGPPPTAAPNPGTPFTALPVAGALLAGAVLAGTAKSGKSDPPSSTTASATFEDGNGGNPSSVPGGPLPLWTPPPDPGSAPMPPAVAAPPPAFPGPDSSSWTDYFQGSPQGGTRP